jgi:hypothetical protein
MKQSGVFKRAAEVLEESAKLAEHHADWEERAGRHDIARAERFQAAWARLEAQRARDRAAARTELDLD